MKVFTVGLDQKPPLKDGTSAEKLPEKDGGSPPPGYVASTNVTKIPLPIGPELPQPPHPIIVRKSRGYKGILMVMLAVFLMAVFALTLSEIAYNRQRDENFFRLRWAELKHRLGYGDNGYDYYHRANAAINSPIDRIYSLSRNAEMMQSETSSTTSVPSTTTEPVVVIDTFPQRPRIFQSKSSSEQADGPLGMIRDARLQFLKTILQKIKQHAEDMGFDGTMQVSVIEVEPQVDDSSPFSSSFGANQMHKPQQLHPLLSNFFPHFPIDEQSPALKPNSPSFLDGFGEIHQPNFFQNNQVVEENRARQNMPFGPFPHDDDQQQSLRNGEFPDPFAGPFGWPRPNNKAVPEFFGPQINNWPMMPQQQSQQGFPQPPHIMPRPPSFDRWSGQNPNQPNIVDSDDSSQQGHPPPPPPMIQIFPHPMMPPMMGQQHGPEQPSGENFSPDSSSSSSSSSSNASPSQEVVGEIYGRKFGRMLQDIIANRIQGFQHLQQMNPIPPEDRIQIEPPQNSENGPQPLGIDEPLREPINNDEEPMPKTVVDNTNVGGPRGWTHQLSRPTSDSSSNSEENRGAQQQNSHEEVAPLESAPTVVMGSTGPASSESNKDTEVGSNGSDNKNGPHLTPIQKMDDFTTK